jgi:hypothetical protein
MTFVKKFLKFGSFEDRSMTLLIHSTPFFLFWYLALFPGLLSFDPKVLLGKIVSGETTNLWSGSYFWFIKISTINGKVIFVTSFLTLLTLTLAICRLINSLPLTINNKLFSLRCVLVSPFYGFVGVNISRDVLQCSAIIFLVSYGFRKSQKRQNNNFDLIAGLILFQFSNIGIIVAICYILILIILKQFRLMTSLLIGLATLNIVSNWTLEKNSVGQFFAPFISDLKCVVQDSDSRISEKHLDFLFTLAPEAIWRKPVSCSIADFTNASISNPNTDPSSIIEFFSVYGRISIDNGPTVVMAHIQRSRGSLPPPFFPGPANQIDLNPSIPIGLNSNFALQDGAPVIHPSLDDKKYYVSTPISRVLFPLVQLVALLINQASWFWGWGGLWFWPILLITLLWRREKYVKEISLVFFPLLITHLLYFIFSPSPSPRFYLGTILVGLCMSIATIVSEFRRNSTSHVGAFIVEDVSLA